jgi:hypothetical protein
VNLSNKEKAKEMWKKSTVRPAVFNMSTFRDKLLLFDQVDKKFKHPPIKFTDE